MSEGHSTARVVPARTHKLPYSVLRTRVPGTRVPVVRLKSTLHLKSTLLLKITLILKYSRISLIYCQMQLIWVLVSTNDVLNNWIIMVLKNAKEFL